MKTKNHINFLLAILLIFSFFQSVKAGPIEGAGTITLGKKSNNCSGFGICNIASDKSNSPVGNMSCVFIYEEEKGIFIIRINQSEIFTKSADKSHYFQNESSVTIEEDFIIPNDVISLLGISKNLTIKKGTHELISKAGQYEIIIAVK